MESWKILLIAAAAALIVGGTTYMTVDRMTNRRMRMSSEITDAFKKWSMENMRMYADEETTNYKMGVFAMNYKKIQSHNAKSESYTMSMNQFMDMTHEEFVATYLTLQVAKTASPYGVHMETGDIPNAVDWRTKGAVAAVKNQAQCGSCWAFSAVAALESDSKIQKGDLPNLSEQQLVSCSGSFGNQGCNGGWMDYAFQYVIKNGIVGQSTYPYTSGTGITGQCKAEKTSPVAFKIASFKDVAAGSVSGLQSAVTQQPVAIAVDATNWQFYSSGVFSNCAAQLNHGVLAAGFDGSSNWIVKNSWGTSWGAQGYITLKSGNTCGCANAASYPLV